jgi:uncharacterized circularly permuted ATP-grasp superfamily protein
VSLNLLQMPLPDRSTYNEFAPDGVTPRPYWSAFVDSIQEMSADELVRRWERAERRICENGVTYNVYTDPQGVNRPLAIDPIPLLVLRKSGVTSRPASSSGRSYWICCWPTFTDPGGW